MKFVTLRSNDLHGQLANDYVLGHACNARSNVPDQHWSVHKRFVHA